MYIKRFEGFDFKKRIWLMTLKDPYYAIILKEMVGMDDDKLEEWLEKRENFNRDNDIKYGNIFLFKEYNYLGLPEYSWAGDKEYEYWMNKCEDETEDWNYMGRITKEYIDKHFPEKVEEYRIKNNMNKYNL